MILHSFFIGGSYVLLGYLKIYDNEVEYINNQYPIDHQLYHGSSYAITPTGIQIGSMFYSILPVLPENTFQHFHQPLRLFTYRDIRDIILKETLYNSPHIETMSIL